MLSVITLLVVAVVSLLITRIASLALVLTGMSRQAARFQARSALTGTGFTTAEAESVVGHPVRRRIAMALMLVGGVGIITTITTLMIGFADAPRGQAFTRLGVLLAALAALLALSRSRWFDQMLNPLLARLLHRYTGIKAQDYAEVLHLGGDWEVGEVHAGADSWLAGKSLEQLELRAEGVAVLGIEHHDGSYFGAPRFDTEIKVEDVLLLYGRRARLGELEGRPAGASGDQAHRDAVEAAIEHSVAERVRERESKGKS